MVWTKINFIETFLRFVTMLELKGNIWDMWEIGKSIVIPINLTLNTEGSLVMGAGLAKDTKERIFGIDRELGETIRFFNLCENNIMTLRGGKEFYFPTKVDWKKPSKLEYIERALPSFLVLTSVCEEVYLPRLGCGLGGLRWEEVREVLQPKLDDRYIVLQR